MNTLDRLAWQIRIASQRLRKAALEFETAMAQVDKDLAAIIPKSRLTKKPALTVVRDSDDK